MALNNMNDVRETFYEMAMALHGVEQANVMREELEAIIGDGSEIFEVEGWRDARYVLTKSDAGIWSWVFEDPIEGPEYGDSFETRREAMYSMARDADKTLVLDTEMGNRIRAAI